MSHNDPSNSDEILDSRDIIKRREELESERDDLRASLSEAEEALALFELAEDKSNKDESDELHEARDKAREKLEEWGDDYGDELKALVDLCNEAEGYAEDWRHGATLIRDSYFTEYAQELVSEVGDMPREIPSYIVIDWDATADNLKADYTSVSFDGVDYWVR